MMYVFIRYLFIYDSFNGVASRLDLLGMVVVVVVLVVVVVVVVVVVLPYYFHVPIVLKSGRLNYLEPYGPVQHCRVIALHLPSSSSSCYYLF
jgi:hypothetical protein